MKTLKDLLEGYVSVCPDIDINGLSLDSRLVKEGDLFFAYPGYSIDRRDYIPQVIEKGAVAVLCESDEDNISFENGVPIIPCKNVISKISNISSRVYDHPSKDMTVVGITGTCGKTSSSHLLSQALDLLGQKSGVIGSNGCGFLDSLNPSHTTTPDYITTQYFLDYLLKNKTKAVTMEATSHALHQDRVAGVDIDMGVFTNLGRDHFDYHKDEKSYAAAKRRLFEMPTIKYGIFNVDDPYGLQWIKDFKSDFEVCGFSVNPDNKFSEFPVVTACDIELDINGLSAQVTTPWGEGKLKCPLLGRFNVPNLLVVITALGLLGYSTKDIFEVLPKLKPVRGRMQVLGGGSKPTVVIDFSHKPDALKEALMALKGHCEGDLFCVFGCGGDRDRGKRPIMASIAEEFSDRIVVTSDNVRFEDPKAIIKDVLEGISDLNKVDVEVDRVLAIEFAIREAKAGDIILLAGKGHETYTIIGDEHLPFDEEEIVNRLLKVKD